MCLGESAFYPYIKTAKSFKEMYSLCRMGYNLQAEQIAPLGNEKAGILWMNTFTRELFFNWEPLHEGYRNEENMFMFYGERNTASSPSVIAIAKVDKDYNKFPFAAYAIPRNLESKSWVWVSEEIGFPYEKGTSYRDKEKRMYYYQDKLGQYIEDIHDTHLVIRM